MVSTPGKAFALSIASTIEPGPVHCVLVTSNVADHAGLVRTKHESATSFGHMARIVRAVLIAIAFMALSLFLISNLHSRKVDHQSSGLSDLKLPYSASHIFERLPIKILVILIPIVYLKRGVASN